MHSKINSGAFHLKEFLVSTSAGISIIPSGYLSCQYISVKW